MTRASFALALLLLAPGLARAAPPQELQSLSLPRAARPRSIAASEDGRTLFVGTSRRRNLDELYAIDSGVDGRSLTLLWSLDVGARVNAIAAAGARIYLATNVKHKALVIVDAAERRIVGTFAADGRASATTVQVVAPDVVLLGRRSGPGPELYRLDVSDPAHVAVLETTDDPHGARPPAPQEVPGYVHRGRLAGSITHATPRGFLSYLAVADRDAEVQVVERTVPVTFADVNGDGVYRLGCVGDSNTAAPLPAIVKWCELLRDRIDDPDFQIVNVAVSGATVVSPNLRFDSDAMQQMQEVLGDDVDAVVLAFGTNDALQGRKPAQIVAAYLDQQAVAAAAGVAFFVATTPPLRACFTSPCPGIAATNDQLRTTFPDHILEFFTGFEPEDLRDDGIHFNDAGQERRAERAFAVLANPFVYDVP